MTWRVLRCSPLHVGRGGTGYGPPVWPPCGWDAGASAGQPEPEGDGDDSAYDFTGKENKNFDISEIPGREPARRGGEMHLEPDLGVRRGSSSCSLW